MVVCVRVYVYVCVRACVCVQTHLAKMCLMCSDMTSTNVAAQMSVLDGSQLIQVVYGKAPLNVYLQNVITNTG